MDSIATTELPNGMGVAAAIAGGNLAATGLHRTLVAGQAQ